jgi:hypothetical protein
MSYIPTLDRQQPKSLTPSTGQIAGLCLRLQRCGILQHRARWRTPLLFWHRAAVPPIKVRPFVNWQECIRARICSALACTPRDVTWEEVGRAHTPASPCSSHHVAAALGSISALHTRVVLLAGLPWWCGQRPSHFLPRACQSSKVVYSQPC